MQQQLQHQRPSCETLMIWRNLLRLSSICAAASIESGTQPDHHLPIVAVWRAWMKVQVRNSTPWMKS